MDRISKENLEKYKTIEELVEAMVTDKNGKRLNYSEVGETNDFIYRFGKFKEILYEKFPNLELNEILFIINNRDVIGYVSSWYGADKLLTLLEYELKKDGLWHTK
jgi:hypothetical protein